MPRHPAYRMARRSQLLTDIQNLCIHHHIPLPMLHIMYAGESHNGAHETYLGKLEQDLLEAGCTVPPPAPDGQSQDRLSGSDGVLWILCPRWHEQVAQRGLLYEACQKAMAHAQELQNQGRGPGLWVLWHSGEMPTQVPEGLEGLWSYYQGAIDFRYFDEYGEAFFGTSEQPDQGLVSKILGLQGKALDDYRGMLKEYEAPSLPRPYPEPPEDVVRRVLGRIGEDVTRYEREIELEQSLSFYVDLDGQAIQASHARRFPLKDKVAAFLSPEQTQYRVCLLLMLGP